MTSPHERVNEKIDETLSIIETTKKRLSDLGVPSYVQSLQLSSFEQRLADLKQERNSIGNLLNKEEMVVTMQPPNLPAGQISVRALTVILGGLQNLSDSIANTLFNQPSEEGKIPQEILEQNELILRETKAGSFKAILDANHPKQFSHEEPVQSQTIAELFRLLETSDSSNTLAETISQLGPRTLKNYTDWTKSIKELDTSLEIELLSSYRPLSRINLDTTKAGLIYSMLSDFSNTTEMEVEIKGKLTGANIRVKNFEIVTDNADKVTGRISKDALEVVAQFGLNNDCVASLLKVTVIGPANREKVFWTLKSIKV